MKCKLVWQWNFSHFLWRGEEINTEWMGGDRWLHGAAGAILGFPVASLKNSWTNGQKTKPNNGITLWPQLKNYWLRKIISQELLWYPPKQKSPSSKWRCQFLDTGIKLNNDFLCFTKQMLRIVYVLYNIEEVVEGIWFLWLNL
jgi:hypothetical protein